jgi:hypothetical protein
MNTYLIRLNGHPLMEIDIPPWMRPQAVARDVLTGGVPEGVTVRWLP